MSRMTGVRYLSCGRQAAIQLSYRLLCSPCAKLLQLVVSMSPDPQAMVAVLAEQPLAQMLLEACVGAALSELRLVDNPASEHHALAGLLRSTN